MNKVSILGHLGQDPEVRYTANGTAVANFSVATNEYYTDRNGNKQESTEWHRVTVWGKMAENCGEYLAKGRQVLVEGRIQTRRWKDRDGNDRETKEISAQRVEFIGGAQAKKEKPSSSQQELSYGPPPSDDNVFD